jgi:type II secretory pathway component GspD/PulD (secretin)
LRPKLASLIVFALAAALLLDGCCTRDSQQVKDVIFAQPVSICSTGRREFQLTQEAKRYEYPDIENADGTVTRVIWVQEGQGTNLGGIVGGNPAFSTVRTSTRPNFFRDALTPAPPPGNRGPEYVSVPSNEAFVLTGPRDNVNAATELVNGVLTSIPQIEIEARIVEVREDDDFALGTDLFVLNEGDHPFDPLHPNAPLNPTASLFDRGRSTFGIPGLTGNAPVLLELGTITHGLQMDMLIQAMKALTKADVLSAPRIAVLNGFKAEFSAGEDVPILKQNVVGTTVTITTEYRPVGIKLLVVPSLVSRDIVRMSVRTKVENVVGVSALVTGTTVTPSPIISVREATTTVDVRDGAAVVIGGLFTTAKTERTDRVPILGEIPILSAFFGSTHTQDAHTNLLFFIRPRLISPGGQSGAVITPPLGEVFPESAPIVPSCPAPCPPAPCPQR